MKERTAPPPWEELPSELWNMVFLEARLYLWDWLHVLGLVCRKWRGIAMARWMLCARCLRASAVMNAPSPDLLNWSLGFPKARRGLIKEYGGRQPYLPDELLLKLVDADRPDVLEELFRCEDPFDWLKWQTRHKCVYCRKFGDRSPFSKTEAVCAWKPGDAVPATSIHTLHMRAIHKGSLGVVRWIVKRVRTGCTKTSDGDIIGALALTECVAWSLGQTRIAEWAMDRRWYEEALSTDDDG
ncbi:hypothetical protein QOT17_003432 [Balamuthia mandrillaris]